MDQPRKEKVIPRDATFLSSRNIWIFVPVDRLRYLCEPNVKASIFPPVSFDRMTLAEVKKGNFWREYKRIYGFAKYL